MYVCMSLVHLTEMKGDRHSDEEINRLSAGSSKREREYTGSRDQQCPHSGFVYTGALLNSVAFKQTERERSVGARGNEEGKRDGERERVTWTGEMREERAECYLYYPSIVAHAVWRRSRLSSAVSEAAAARRRKAKCLLRAKGRKGMQRGYAGGARSPRDTFVLVHV